MSRAARWLRVSYWIGALADGVVALTMLAQAVLGHSSPLTGHVPDNPYRYAMGLAGSLMLGWTLLLLWADRRPVERRGVLPLTCVVLLGLMASGGFAAISGFMPRTTAAALIGIQFGLAVLFATSYGLAQRADSRQETRHERQR